MMKQVGSVASLIFFSISLLVHLLFVYDSNNKEKKRKNGSPKKNKSKHVAKLSMTTESVRQLLQMLVECGFIMLYIWWCENMPYTPHEQRFGTKTLFWTLFAIFTICALLTFKRNKNDINTVLNRDQTEEWKGWMQYLFLAYHYFHEKEVYNAIRIFISCYVWMTGFGNVSFFYIKQDFGIIRFLQMMWRLNFFVFLLCVILDNTYILYYICPLHTFYFLTTFVVMRIQKESNHTSQFILRLKLICFGLLVYVIWEFPAIFNLVWSFLSTEQIVGAQSGTRHEWHFRSGLDHYSAMFGMIFAINFPLLVTWTARVEKLQKSTNMLIKCFLLIPLLIGFVMWVKNIFFLPKLQYNQMHPYFFWIPLLFYIFLRNMSSYGRMYHSNLLAQMGKITLETYLLQHHVWLADNAKSRFILIPGYPLINMVITTAIYIYISFRMFRITIGLRAMLIPNNKNEAFKNLLYLFVGFGICYMVAFCIMSLNRHAMTTKILMIIWTSMAGASVVYNYFQASIQKAKEANKDGISNQLEAVDSTISTSVELQNEGNKRISNVFGGKMIGLSAGTYVFGMFLFYLANSNEHNNGFDLYSAHHKSKLRDCTTAMGTGVWTFAASTEDCEKAIDEYHGNMCFKIDANQYHFQFARKNTHYPKVLEACPAMRPITHYAPKPNKFWHKYFEESVISIVGDSLARKMTQGVGRLVGHEIPFSEADRHKDKLTSLKGHSHEGIDINFYWRPMASNVHKWFFENSKIKCSKNKKHYLLVSIGAWHVRWDPEDRKYSLKYGLDGLKSTIRDFRMRCPQAVIGWMLPPKIEPLHLNPERKENMTAARYQRVLDATKASTVMNGVDFVLQADQITNNAAGNRLSLDGVHHNDAVYDVLSQTYGNQLLNLDKINAKLQKVANGANSLAGIAHNPTVGFFTLTIFVLIVLSADNYIGFSRIATSVFGAGYTSIEESYREFHVKNNIK